MPAENYLKALADETGASQDGWEIFQLLTIMDMTDNVNVVLEIGVDTGYLMQLWYDAFGATVIGVDISTTRFRHDSGMGENLIIGDSNSEVTLWQVSDRLGVDEVDLLFIDGDHHYDATLRDFQLYSPLVRKGGLVALHDTSRTPGMYEGVETRAAFDTLRQQYPSIEISNGPAGVGGPGIGVLFV